MPAAENRILVAKVLGKPIYLDQIEPRDNEIKRKQLSKSDYEKWYRESCAIKLLSDVSRQAVADYASREKFSPSREEYAAVIAEVVKKHPGLVKDEEAQRKTGIRLFWLFGAFHDWIVAKALHEKYGGPIAISSFGACTSIEGRNAVLKEYASAGKITFHHAEIEMAFWDRTRDERVLDASMESQLPCQLDWSLAFGQ